MALGSVGAWKVQPFPEIGETFAAPILRSVVYSNGAKLDVHRFPEPAIEAEIAVTLSRDLPRREMVYGVDDIAGALGTLHLAIEVLSRASPQGLASRTRANERRRRRYPLDPNDLPPFGRPVNDTELWCRRLHRMPWRARR